MKTRVKNDPCLWATIPDFPNYEISTHGDVRNIRTQLILKPFVTKLGYSQVILRNYLGGKVHQVHRLVAVTFISNLENKYFVIHIDRIKTNNNIKNLSWNTPKRNYLDYTKPSMINFSDRRGSKNKNSKLKESDILVIRNLIKEGILFNEIGKRFGVSATSISAIKTNKLWSHVK